MWLIHSLISWPCWLWVCGKTSWRECVLKESCSPDDQGVKWWKRENKNGVLSSPSRPRADPNALQTSFCSSFRWLLSAPIWATALEYIDLWDTWGPNYCSMHAWAYCVHALCTCAYMCALHIFVICMSWVCVWMCVVCIRTYACWCVYVHTVYAYICRYVLQICACVYMHIFCMYVCMYAYICYICLSGS